MATNVHVKVRKNEVTLINGFRNGCNKPIIKPNPPNN